MTSEEVFKKFIPESAVPYCNKLYQKLGFEFKIKKARQTKFGDYRYDPFGKKHVITINNDLNIYAFLVTYLHEVAHLIAFKEYGRRIKPHGQEWKDCFKQVTKPLLNNDTFPEPVLGALKRYFKNPKASSCSDPTLYAILKQFDMPTEGIIFLKKVSVGETFQFNNKEFVKLEKKRTRSVCKEISTNKKYLISELAEVLIIEK